MRAAGLAAGAVAAALAAGGNAFVERRRRRGGVDGRWLERWQRTNHSGGEVMLTEGPIAVGSALLGLAVGSPPAPQAAALACALVGGGVVGAFDDHFGGAQAKGFAGHLGALRRGRVTSGLVKVAGVGLSALAASLLVDRSRAGRDGAGRNGAGRGAASRITDVMLDTALVAGTANVVNLLDLRPGRAAKVLLAGGLLTARTGGGAVAGAAAGSLPVDLSARAMLGDAGANGLGAALGVTLLPAPRWLRVALLAGVLGLNVASEKVSFTAVIADHPVLNRIDEWGRPDAGPPPPARTDG